MLLIAVTGCLLVLAVLCVRHGLGHGGTAAAGEALWNGATGISAVTAAATVAAYAILGFDAVSTLAGERPGPLKGRRGVAHGRVGIPSG
ncbi:hypothetical protein [Streptomyces sp. NRRL WC-3626]|uniref:hypothetical protein n=1 Tax=Streptomyces sp. NRRL WC-3626 TaxID=1463926 RepID=UPI0004BF54E6|nr:hypothetical protein [Streptomyces sp. NRRL WC-3626]